MLQMASERLIVWIVGSHIDHGSAAAYDSIRYGDLLLSLNEPHLLVAIRTFHRFLFLFQALKTSTAALLNDFRL